MGGHCDERSRGKRKRTRTKKTGWGCEERERAFGRLKKDGADATRPDLRWRDQTSRGPTHNPLLTQSGRQPSGGGQDCRRGAVEHPLPLRATDVLGLIQAFVQRPTASFLRGHRLPQRTGPDSSLQPSTNYLVTTLLGPDVGRPRIIGCHGCYATRTEKS